MPATATATTRDRQTGGGIEMAEIKLNYVNSYRDPRNKRWRHQFRRKGIRKTTLRGLPGSAEFMAHYAELLAQSENAMRGHRRVAYPTRHHRRGDGQVSATRGLHPGARQGDAGHAASDPRQLPPVQDAERLPLRREQDRHHVTARTSPTCSQASRRPRRRAG